MNSNPEIRYYASQAETLTWYRALAMAPQPWLACDPEIAIAQCLRARSRLLFGLRADRENAIAAIRRVRASWRAGGRYRLPTAGPLHALCTDAERRRVAQRANSEGRMGLA